MAYRATERRKETEQEIKKFIESTNLKNQPREVKQALQKKSTEARKRNYRVLTTFREEFERLDRESDIVRRLCKSAVVQGLRGNISALEFIRDTMGQNPYKSNIQHNFIKKIFVTKGMIDQIDKLINEKIQPMDEQLSDVEQTLIAEQSIDRSYESIDRSYESIDRSYESIDRSYESIDANL